MLHHLVLLHIFAQIIIIMNFSGRIKELCKERGILMKDLAGKLGITSIGLSKSINQPYPQLQTLERIATALGVEVSELFAPKRNTFICPNCGAEIEVKQIES